MGIVDLNGPSWLAETDSVWVKPGGVQPSSSGTLSTIFVQPTAVSSSRLPLSLFLSPSLSLLL